MKKALTFLLAIIFICTVVCYGSGERFSLALMIENLTNFSDMPTLEDLTRIWTDDYYYPEGVLFQPYWVDQHNVIDAMYDIEPRFMYSIPLAIDVEGNLLDSRFEVSYVTIYKPAPMLSRLYTDTKGIYLQNGEWYAFADHNGDGFVDAPIISNWRSAYNDYSGDNAILNFFGEIKAFFVRLWNTIEMVCQMVICVFRNMVYLLPWNNTVKGW